MEQLSPEQLAALAADDLGPLDKHINIAFTSMAIVAVVLRIFTRVKWKTLGWEDYTMVVAEAFTLTMSAFNFLQANAGGGRHTVLLSFPDQIELILKYLFWCLIIYNVALTLVKVSILLQYRRIFTIPEMQLPFNIALGFVITWGICALFTGIFTCVPVDAFWRLEKKPTAHCMEDTHLWIANAAVNIFSDLLVAFLPVRNIWRLQMPKRQKIVLLFILTIGWFICVVSVLRLHTIIVLARNPNDRIYYSAPPSYWSCIELNLSIVCASLPTLKPLVVRIIPAFSTRYSSRGYEQTTSGHMDRSFGNGGTLTGGKDVELAVKSIEVNAYSSKSDQSSRGKNIYVSKHFEQRVEEDGHVSDSESQKDLVTGQNSSKTYAKH